MRVPISRTSVIVGVVVALIVFLFLWSKRSIETDWVEVGMGGPKEKDFPYRYMGDKDYPPTHPDLVALTLDLQSGRARGAWVYAQAFKCYAPKLRDGVPSVACDSVNGASIVVGGADNIRGVLLSLKSGQVGAVKGKAIGLYAGDPVIWVNDPTLKQNANDKT